MQQTLQSLALVVFGVAMLLMQSLVSQVVELHPFTPNLLLPVVIYIGVSPETNLVRGAVSAFVLGYFLDLFSGNLMSLETFVCVATFLLSRGAGLRLFMRNPGLQGSLVFGVAILTGGTTLALRAIFSSPPPFPAGNAWDTALSLLAPALATGLAAPLVFAGVQRVDAAAGRRREESTT